MYWHAAYLEIRAFKDLESRLRQRRDPLKPHSVMREHQCKEAQPDMSDDNVQYTVYMRWPYHLGGLLLLLYLLAMHS